jgi:5'-methylthioadenosine phosphorylase
MTNLAEAKLAREAEMCFATLACITDYDCWHDDETTGSVTLDMIIKNLMQNVETSKNMLKKILPKLGKVRDCVCVNALENAIVTRPGAIPAKTKKKLELIIGKYVK